ncbi:MAG: hypothetical protein ABEI58_02460 [Candidatus Nanohaloarchaea archaeon]
MGGWSASVDRFLNGDSVSDPGDFARLLGREIEEWYPAASCGITQDEASDRDLISGGEIKSIASSLENYVAENYRGEIVDNGAVDVRLGLSERAQGWPVQVKSTTLYVFRGLKDDFTPDVREGAFKLREEQFDKLPDESLLAFYVYNPSSTETERGIDTVYVENEGMYAEVLGELVLPKTMVEEAVELPWYENGHFELKWTDLFGVSKHGSPIYQDIVARNRQEKNQDPSFEITEY